MLLRHTDNLFFGKYLCDIVINDPCAIERSIRLFTEFNQMVFLALNNRYTVKEAIIDIAPKAPRTTTGSQISKNELMTIHGCRHRLSSRRVILRLSK